MAITYYNRGGVHISLDVIREQPVVLVKVRKDSSGVVDLHTLPRLIEALQEAQERSQAMLQRAGSAPRGALGKKAQASRQQKPAKPSHRK